jgi:hypothetical protein
VVHQQSETRARARRRPLQHLEIAVRIAEGEYRPPADVLVDADGLAGLVVDEVDLGQTHERRPAVAQFVLRADAGTDHLLRRHAVDTLREHAQELDAAARNDEYLESVGPQVLHELELRPVHELRVRPAEAGMLGSREPVAHDPGEFLGRRAGVRRHHDFEERMLTARRERAHVALEHGLERLGVLPLGVRGRQRLHPVQRKRELHVRRLLRP